MPIAKERLGSVAFCIGSASADSDGRCSLGSILLRRRSEHVIEFSWSSRKADKDHLKSLVGVSSERQRPVLDQSMYKTSDCQLSVMETVPGRVKTCSWRG